MSTQTATLTDPGCNPTARSKSIVFVSRETGTLWFAGWLFTIGIAGLTFWKGVLALIVWPYFLGVLARGG
jgi:hypothetical protein